MLGRFYSELVRSSKLCLPEKVRTTFGVASSQISRTVATDLNCPQQNVVSNPRKLKPKRTEVDSETVERLERLALVNFSSEAGIQELSAVISIAMELHKVDTTNVEPMESPLEDRSLYLREDVVAEGNCNQDILTNSAKTEEDYFVAPPGNIPLSKNNTET